MEHSRGGLCSAVDSCGVMMMMEIKLQIVQEKKCLYIFLFSLGTLVQNESRYPISYPLHIVVWIVIVRLRGHLVGVTAQAV